ncbi:ABC-type sugar transport system, substrate-binding protein, contains N-terminal xre family HTH domain [Amycolatopsis sacchari]|uniref:ABC-type sugar transport system, substrate-binding protein, contains N-terminal xre family HTH domain n=1 Tax=Amycolatopsis sacchari TaxID=115433 RepID=A0A1I3WIP3_9PSEU|nr:ABC-type sugar transport system, substrate-binding protein, contains N-terminal xre family HTH domain [Amycolatopsis sacchari]
MRSFTRGIPSARSATVLVPALLAVGTLVTACGSTTQTGERPSSAAIEGAQATVREAEKVPTTISATTPLTKRPPTGKSIVFLQDGTQPSVEIYGGIQEAAEALGWTARSIKFDPADLSTLNAGLLQALTTGADYVVDSGFPESQLSTSTVAKFKAAGVPIIVVGTTPVPETDTLLGDYSDQNHYVLAGKQLADWFVTDADGQGTALVVNLTTYPSLTLFTDSFSAEVAKICPSCRTDTIKSTIGDALKGTLTAQVIAKLRADRSIKYAVFDNSGEIAGLDAQLKTAGRTDVKVIGHGIDPVTLKSLESGQAKAFIAYNFRYSGWAATDIAARKSVGDPVANPKSVQPSQLITSATANQLPANAIFREPADGLQQFKKLWLVSGS